MTDSRGATHHQDQTQVVRSHSWRTQGIRARINEARASHSFLELVNSMALILGRVASMGLGFLTWLVAARLYAQAEVGLASGAVSAMMLCVQIALLGIGSAAIALFPRYQGQPAELLDTAFTIVGVAALAAGGLFLLVAAGIFEELSIVGSVPSYTVLFLGMCVFGTLGVMFDFVSISLRRGDQVLVRNVLFGIVTLVLIAVLPLVTGDPTASGIFVAWAAGGLTACLIGVVQLHRSVSQYRYRFVVKSSVAKQLIGIGLPNWALTLTERAPAQIMPIVVTELISPAANAIWYIVWMMAWVVFIVPISIGQNLFAGAVHHPEALQAEIKRSTWTSLVFGGIGAVAVALVAPFILSLLGSTYASAGTTPLRILVFGVLPWTFIQSYFAICRASGKLAEAVISGTVNGLLSVGGVAIAGMHYGLTGMALTWLGIQVATGVWSIWRLQSISKQYHFSNGQRNVQGSNVNLPTVNLSHDPPVS